jgi:branched-subunit amino acid permease
MIVQLAIFAFVGISMLILIAARRHARSKLMQVVHRDRALALMLAAALGAVLIGLARLGGPSSDTVIIVDLAIFCLLIGWLLWPRD